MAKLIFEKDLIEKVWLKAKPVAGYDETKIRKDKCGAWIMREMIGNKESQFGWVIDHILPLGRVTHEQRERLKVAIVNLEPLHWRNNLSKGADYPVFASSVTSDGGRNVEIRKFHEIEYSEQKEIESIKNEVVSNFCFDVKA